MPSMADLQQMFGGGMLSTPPEVNLMNIQDAWSESIADQAFREGIIAENMPWDLSKIASERGGRGISRHSGVGVEQGRVIQLANQQVSQGRYDLDKNLQKLASNRFLTTLGIPLGSTF